MPREKILLPKVELHVHLDCCLSFEVVASLRPTITYEQYRQNFVAPKRCTNLADFLTRAPRGVELMQREHELRAVTLDLFRQFKADGVIYAEIRFAPLLHCDNGLTPDEVVRIVDEAVEEGIVATGVDARLILCTLRHFDARQSAETVGLIEQCDDGTRVVALDIAGDEAGFPIDTHLEAFEYAKQKRLFRTAHAGEATGASSVWETLRNFEPQRIGHGVRSAEEPALVKHLREKQVHLEVCPSSNLQTNVYSSLKEHPIKRLFEAGVSVGINTDARTITDTTLENEYGLLRDEFGWDNSHFLKCNLDAVRASFIPEQVETALTSRLQSSYGTESAK
jgi:adenosine deaminase